jgi:hypothetical protein
VLNAADHDRAVATDTLQSEVIRLGPAAGQDQSWPARLVESCTDTLPDDIDRPIEFIPGPSPHGMLAGGIGRPAAIRLEHCLGDSWIESGGRVIVEINVGHA